MLYFLYKKEDMCMSDYTVEKVAGKVASFFKIVLFFIVGFPLATAGIFELFLTIKRSILFIDAGIFPAGHVMMMFSLALISLSVSALFGKLAFVKLFSKISYGILWSVLGLSVAAGVCFSIYDYSVRDSFEYVDYPSYIEQMNTEVLYETRKCSYSETIYIEGYLTFIENDFRPNAVVQVQQDDSLTEAYRVEVHYKGDTAEMYINSLVDDEGRRVDSLSVWPKSYDYDMSDSDYVYMYKNEENLEYAEPLAIEKIIIRTAYPEMIDVSGIDPR